MNFFTNDFGNKKIIILKNKRLSYLFKNKNFMSNNQVETQGFDCISNNSKGFKCILPLYALYINNGKGKTVMQNPKNQSFETSSIPGIRERDGSAAASYRNRTSIELHRPTEFTTKFP